MPLRRTPGETNSPTLVFWIPNPAPEHCGLCDRGGTGRLNYSYGPADHRTAHTHPAAAYVDSQAAYADSNTYSIAYGDAYAHAHANPHTYGDCDAGSDGNSDTDADSFADADSNAGAGSTTR